jgi:hypothetical protein
LRLDNLDKGHAGAGHPRRRCRSRHELCALYLLDHFEYDGYYANVLWYQADALGQQYEQQLKAWWGSR